jgi:hypothetical protein
VNASDTEAFVLSTTAACPQWVNLDRVGQGEKSIYVRYAPDSDPGGESAPKRRDVPKPAGSNRSKLHCYSITSLPREKLPRRRLS